MNNLTRFSLTAPVETVLKKLNKANVPIYNLRKKNSLILFSTDHKFSKKVFAIFSHPCYNINVEVYGFKQNFLHFALNRIGIFIGAIIFLACVLIANTLVLKIEIVGSGNYLQNEIKRVLNINGITNFSRFDEDKKPLITAQILSLPQVSFCSVQKRGSVLVIDVAAEENSAIKIKLDGLYSDVNGTLQKIVALCGTAQFNEGDEVKKGDLLIAAYSIYGEEKVACMAAGYATILCYASVDYFAETESEQSQSEALKSVNLYADNILEKSFTVIKNTEGVIYKIDFSYLHTLTINL